MKKVLVIDDEKQILKVVKTFLEDQGYQVDCAEEREEAEAMIETLEYGIVVTDLTLDRLKGLEGLSILEHVQQVSPRSRVIVMSGISNLGEAREASAGRIDGFLPKPLSLPALRDSVSHLMEQSDAS